MSFHFFHSTPPLPQTNFLVLGRPDGDLVLFPIEPTTQEKCQADEAHTDNSSDKVEEVRPSRCRLASPSGRLCGTDRYTSREEA